MYIIYMQCGAKREKRGGYKEREEKSNAFKNGGSRTFND